MGYGYGFGLLLIFVAVVGWIIVDYSARKRRPTDIVKYSALQRRPTDPAEGGSPMTILDSLDLFQRENPDLPVVPSSTAVYEVWEIWFQEAMKRIALRSTLRTREEAIKLNEQLLHFQLQCLTYLKNKASIREVGALADLEFEAKKKEILLRIAQSEAAIRDLNNPDRHPRRHIDV